jgi:hypothetical protein
VDGVSRRAPLFATALRTALPMWLWAAHFAFSYVIVAIGCQAGWQQAGPGAWSRLELVLALGSTLAVGAALLLLVRACRGARLQPGLSGLVHRLVAVLALLGIVWTTVPMGLLPLCRWA